MPGACRSQHMDPSAKPTWQGSNSPPGVAWNAPYYRNQGYPTIQGVPPMPGQAPQHFRQHIYPPQPRVSAQHPLYRAPQHEGAYVQRPIQNIQQAPGYQQPPAQLQPHLRPPTFSYQLPQAAPAPPMYRDQQLPRLAPYLMGPGRPALPFPTPSRQVKQELLDHGSLTGNSTPPFAAPGATSGPSTLRMAVPNSYVPPMDAAGPSRSKGKAVDQPMDVLSYLLDEEGVKLVASASAELVRSTLCVEELRTPEPDFPVIPRILELVPSLANFVAWLLLEVHADDRRKVAAGTICLLDRISGRFPNARTRFPHLLYLTVFVRVVRQLLGEEGAHGKWVRFHPIFREEVVIEQERLLGKYLLECYGRVQVNEELRDVWKAMFGCDRQVQVDPFPHLPCQTVERPELLVFSGQFDPVDGMKVLHLV